MRKLLLCSAAVLGSQLALVPAAFALGSGGSGGGNVPTSSFQVNGLGPLSGEWDVKGGIDAYVSALTNKTPQVFNNEGSLGSNAKYSIAEAAVQIHKSTGWLQFTYWGGAWSTPAIGITSDYGAFNSLARLGSGGNPLPSSPTFKWWFTVQPSQYYSIDAGELASTEGTEIGFDWMNPTFFVSNLNNMQTTPAYGTELNLFYGPASLTVQWSDSYKTDRFNMVSTLFTYNLNADGSDNVIVFSHTNLGHTGNPGPGFAEFNSSLVGGGATIVQGPWTFSPEAQYQWLPKSSVTASNGFAKPLTTYYEASAMADVTYQIDPKWSVTVQPSVTYQKGDKSDPNQQIYGNWLQFGAGANPGAFSPGMTLTAIQVDPTWQDQNVFVRPVLALTHLSGFARGTGYGNSGNSANQVVGVLEVGVLLGKL